MAVFILHAGKDRRVLINAVDINGNFKISAASNATLKTQRVGGILLYDGLALSLNMADKATILRINHSNTLESLNLRNVASNVFTKQYHISNDAIYASGSITNADKSTSYTKQKCGP